MSDEGEAPLPLPTRAVDARGRIVPLTPDQLAARSEAFHRYLATVAEGPHDPPGSDEEFMRAVDSRRPHRPLFEGMYPLPTTGPDARAIEPRTEEDRP